MSGYSINEVILSIYSKKTDLGNNTEINGVDTINGIKYPTDTTRDEIFTVPSYVCVKSDSVMEVGKYIDIHDTKEYLKGYSVRLAVEGIEPTTNITEFVVIEEGVESIRRCALTKFEELKMVSITTINSNPFTDRPKLAQIEVSENNLRMATMDGVLFDKEKTVLISCPQTMSEVY